MVLERIEYQNFQRFKTYVLELDPHVTTIVGPTDHGKSTALRGLRWLCFNRPAGAAFIRFGADRSRVTLAVDGRAVRRKKKRQGGGAYTLDGKVYGAIGSSVPPEIEALLNVGDINFQRQMDPPFWLSLSPPEVSRALNQVVNLGLIDRVLAAVAAEVRQATAALAVSEERLATARQRRQALAWVPAAVVKLGKIGKLGKLAQETAVQARRLAEQLKTASTLARSLKSRQGADLATQSAIARLGGLRDRAAAACTNRQALERLVEQLGRAEEQACRSKAEHAEARASLDKATVGRCPACLRPLASV